jgi:hypothetical protein
MDPTVIEVRNAMPRNVKAAPLTTRRPKSSAVGRNAF